VTSREPLEVFGAQQLDVYAGTLTPRDMDETVTRGFPTDPSRARTLTTFSCSVDFAEREVARVTVHLLLGSTTTKRHPAAK
jgi:hypothetical protein